MPGSSQNPQPTQTTTQTMSPEQQQLFKLAMPGVENWAATVPQRYQGSTIAPQSPNQITGQEMALGAVPAQKNTADLAGSASSNILSGNAANDSFDNGLLRKATDAATRPIINNLMEDVLPGLRGDAIKAGGFGGSREGIAEGLATGRAAQAVGDTSAKVSEDLYKTNVDAQLKALGLVPTVQGAQVQPALTTSGVGDAQNAYTQAGLNQDVSNFNYDQNAGYLQSKDILSLLLGVPGGTTTSTANNPSSSYNPMTSLSGALGGASLGSMLMPGAGTAIGAGAGALLPFLMSRG